ncbi:MAG TPA: DNA polymerase III subunit gamma/tau [Treponema sp.]|nr:DNA polymerase III subunit gamma/tau [Treponema sp.]
MAYEVTATRRRPGRFEDLIGQDFVVATLQKSLSAGKIAPAYLFSGSRGCGKTSSARILAKSLNCLTGKGASPCGTCAACIEISTGSSLDVIEIDGASNTGVNDVRQIREEVQFPPNSYRYKVYIIDEVHMLSTSAFNALLKTIEEPPPYVVFIFATTELHKVPATIKSRCQHFNFRLVSVELLKNALVEAAAENGITADDEALFWIAREATGSVRDAYTLFDQIASFSDGHITFDKIRDKLGLVGIDRISAIVSSCATGNTQEALSALDEILDSGVSVEQFTVDMADYFRSLLLIQNGITKESLLGQKSERFSKEALSAWSAIQIERALAIFLQLYRDLRYSLDERYELELALSRVAWIVDYVSPAEMKKAITQAQSILLGRGAPSSAPPRRDAPPFPEADRLPESETVEAVRDEQLTNPFADLKRRMNGGYEPSEASGVVDENDSLEEEDSTAEIGETAANTPQIEDTLLPPLGEPCNVEDLQEKLVSFFSSTRNMLASTLSQTFDWKENKEGIVFSVRKSFLYTTIKQDYPLLSSAVSQLLGRVVTVEVKLEKKSCDDSSENLVNTIPEQVENIRQMFKGVILGEEEKR